MIESEVVVFALLLALSFLASAGIWRTIGNLAYIYFFPFVLIFYLVYFSGKTLLVIARAFDTSPRTPAAASANDQTKLSNPVVFNAIETDASGNSEPSNMRQFALVITRPLRRFTLLWCLLLLITTHAAVLSLSLVVVLLHLARTVFRVLQFTVLAGPWFDRVGKSIREWAEKFLSKLSAINPDSPPSQDLKNLWNQLQLFEKGVRILENESIVLKWTWMFCSIVIVGLYLYLALLFSFAYYGIARVGGSPVTWADCIVTSLFIPFLITDFPKLIGLKLLGGIHCALIVTVGTGTILNYFRTRLAPIRAVVTVVGG